MVQQRTAYTAETLALQLGWTGRQFTDACRLKLVPQPAVSRPKSAGPRSSAEVARRLIMARNVLRINLDAGVASRSDAARLLAGQLGVPVEPDTIDELGRLGYIPFVQNPAGSNFRGISRGGIKLYAVWAVNEFNDLDALAQAAFSGRLHTSTDVAAELRVRRVDVDRLIRCDLLRPVRLASNPQYSSAGPVQLFRHGDVVALQEYHRIDWEAVRSTPPGRRSPLAGLPPADDNDRAELERLARGTLYHRLGHRKWGAGDTDAAVGCWQIAADYPDAAEHLEGFAAGDNTLMLRCAAMNAFQSMSTRTA